MCLTASKNKDIVEFMVCGERIQLDRKTIIDKSKFFKNLLSSSGLNGHTIVIHDTDVAAFKTFAKILDGKQDCVTHDNLHDLVALARNIQSDFLMLKCVEYFASLPEEDMINLCILSLEKAVEMKEGNYKAFLTKDLATVFCPNVVVRYKKDILKLSPKSQTFILELMIDGFSTTIDRDEKVKKLEQKSKILEAQLRKALEELRSSKDQQKTFKDAEIELSKLKKKLDKAEKKIKSHEEELEKLRKILTSENKKNQMLHKELKKSLQTADTAKNDFNAAIERERLEHEKRLEDLKDSFNAEIETLKQVQKSKERKLNTEYKHMKKTICRLNRENQFKTNVSNVDAETSTNDMIYLPTTSCIETQTEEECYRFDHNNLAQIWDSTSSNSVYMEDVTATTMTFNKYEWKKRPVWNNALFL